jgi:hypothetical protein
MMEAVRTSETSVNLYETTRRNIPEDGHLEGRFFVYFCKWRSKLLECSRDAYISLERGILISNMKGRNWFSCKKKSKVVPLHAMEAHGGRGGIAPTHS